MDTQNGGCGWESIEACIFAELQTKEDLLSSFDWVKTEIYIRENHALSSPRLSDVFRHQNAVAHRRVLLKYFQEYIGSITESSIRKALVIFACGNARMPVRPRIHVSIFI